MTSSALMTRVFSAVRPTKRKAGTSPSLVGGVSIIVVLAAIAVLGPVVSPYGVTTLGDEALAGPSTQHWLGTDNIGRDSFTRLAVAIGSMILISLVSTIIALVVGVALGVLAGYVGGVADMLVMRSVEVLMTIPAILMALVVRVVFGPGIVPLIIAMAIVSAPMFARVMRGPIMVLRERDYVVAAEIGGVRRVMIAIRHLVPNALTPIVVQFANTASMAVLLEASLSYLGQGIQPPEPSAGRMISEYQRFMLDDPQLVLIPAAAVTVLTIGWNLIADGVQARMSPRAASLHTPISTRSKAD